MVVERGDYPAHHVAACIDGYSKRDFAKFSFPPVPGTFGIGASFPFEKAEGIPGEICAANINPKQISDWADDGIARAVAPGGNKNRIFFFQ